MFPCLCYIILATYVPSPSKFKDHNIRLEGIIKMYLYCGARQLIALLNLNLSVLGFSFVFHDKAKRTQQGNLLKLGGLFLLFYFDLVLAGMIQSSQQQQVVVLGLRSNLKPSLQPSRLHIPISIPICKLYFSELVQNYNLERLIVF